MGDDVLGTPKAWQIKDFPEGLRNRVIAAARDAEQSVADYVTGIMLRHLDGAAMPPGARFNAFANRVNRPDPAIAELAMLLTAVGTLPAHIALPAAVRTLINARARQARGRPRPPQPDEPAPAAIGSEPAPIT